MIGILGRPAVIDSNHRLGGLNRKMHCPVTEINLCCPVVESKRGTQFSAVVVTCIAVGDRVSFCQSMIGEIQIPILSPVTPVKKTAVPVFRQRQLQVVDDGRPDDSFHIAVLTSG